MSGVGAPGSRGGVSADELVRWLRDKFFKQFRKGVKRLFDLGYLGEEEYKKLIHEIQVCEERVKRILLSYEKDEKGR